METKSLECLDLNDAVKSAKSACDRAREIVFEVSALRGRGRSKPKIRVSLPQLIRNTLNSCKYYVCHVNVLTELKNS